MSLKTPLPHRDSASDGGHQAASPCHRIGRWSFDPSEPVLRDGADERRLEDRAARTLEFLCVRRGEVVAKHDLLAAVWGGRTVSANSVAVVIGALRRALEDDPSAPTHITTVAKRGYRLELPASVQAVEAEPSWSSRRVVRLGLVGTAVALTLAALAIRLETRSIPVTVTVEAVRNDTGQRALDPLAAALEPVVVAAATHLQGVRVVPDAEAGGGADAVGGRAGRRVVVRSRLILWDGAPELALTATDLRSGAALWSGFAAGPNGDLARHVAAKLVLLQPRLSRATGASSFL